MNCYGRCPIGSTQELTEVGDFLFVRVRGSSGHGQAAMETKPILSHARAAHPGVTHPLRSSAVRPAISSPGEGGPFDFCQLDHSKRSEPQKFDDPQEEERHGPQIGGAKTPPHEVEEVSLAFLQARCRPEPLPSAQFFENDILNHASPKNFGLLSVLLP